MQLQITKKEDRYVIEAPASAKPDDDFLLEVKFKMLAERWKEEAKFFSFAHQYAKLDSYREIVEMGQPVVPLILQELEEKPSAQWCRMLEEITNENPVAASHRGIVQQMKNDWQLWAKKRKLI